MECQPIIDTEGKPWLAGRPSSGASSHIERAQGDGQGRSGCADSQAPAGDCNALDGLSFTDAAKTAGLERQALGDAAKRYTADGVTEPEARVATTGVLISRRQLMRHCEAGTFDAKRLPAVNNLEQWFIAPPSAEHEAAERLA